MKRILLASVIGIALTGTAYAQAVKATIISTPVPASKATISFAVDTLDFGVIPQGTPVAHVFSFVNTGKTPLILSSATSTCGCVTIEWAKEPIAPGARAILRATYDAKSPSIFSKTIVVASASNDGINPLKMLTIKGETKPAPEKPATPVPPAPAPVPQKN